MEGEEIAGLKQIYLVSIISSISYVVESLSAKVCLKRIKTILGLLVD